MGKETEGLAQVLKMDADLELSQGRVALLTFGMKAAFSQVKTMPLEDFQFKGMPTSDVAVEVEAAAPTTTQDAAEVKKAEDNPKIAKQAEKQAEYDGCLDKKSPEDKDKYCVDKFGEDKAAVADCKVKIFEFVLFEILLIRETSAIVAARTMLMLFIL